MTITHKITLLFALRADGKWGAAAETVLRCRTLSIADVDDVHPFLMPHFSYPYCRFAICCLRPPETWITLYFLFFCISFFLFKTRPHLLQLFKEKAPRQQNLTRASTLNSLSPCFLGEVFCYF